MRKMKVEKGQRKVVEGCFIYSFGRSTDKESMSIRWDKEALIMIQSVVDKARIPLAYPGPRGSDSGERLPLNSFSSSEYVLMYSSYQISVKDSVQQE